MEKVAKNGRKVKAIYSLTFFAVFCPFMKNGRKVKAIAPYFFAAHFWEKSPIYEKNGKIAKNGRKVKAIIALLFCCFLPIYEKWKKSLKMGEK